MRQSTKAGARQLLLLLLRLLLLLLVPYKKLHRKLLSKDNCSRHCGSFVGLLSLSCSCDHC